MKTNSDSLDCDRTSPNGTHPVRATAGHTSLPHKVRHRLKPWLFCGLVAALPAWAAQMTDSFAARPAATSTTATFSGDSTSAGLEPGETPGMHGGNRNHTIWAEWAAPANGWVTIDTLGTTFTKPVLAVYVGTQLSSLAPVARGFEDDSGPNPAMVRFPATTGTAYAIVVDGERNTASGDGPARVNVKFTAAELTDSVVGSDSFPKRGALVGTHALGVCENRLFGRDPYEPPTIGDSERTGWWSWTAPATGEVILDTLQSDFNTTVTVLAGETDESDPFSRLDEIASNDDVPNDPLKRSLVRFQAATGRTYQIVVDGSTSLPAGRGNVILQLRLEPNFKPPGVPGSDSFARRGRLAGFNALGLADNSLFTMEAFEPDSPGLRHHTAWWEWTAPGDGAVVIDTFGSACDTALAVLRGETLANLVRTAFNEDAAGTTNSEVRFTARRGEVFQIVVDGEHSNEASEGNIVLNVNQARTEPHPDLTVYKATEIEIFARQGAVYQLLVSRDLIHWEEWGEPFVGEDQPVRFFDSSRAHGYRFFQAEIR